MKKRIFGVFLILLLLPFCYAIALAEEVPFLTRTYPHYEVKLRLLSDQNSRVSAYAGPGDSYITEWGYKPYKQRKITAYFVENDWVYVDFDYQTVEERYIYIKKSKFESLPERLPNITDLPYYTGKIDADTMPAWGPGSEFNRVDNYIARAGTTIKVFFQENGYVYAEYPCNKKTIRMWLPADHVSMDDAIIMVTDETGKSYKVSTFGKYPSEESWYQPSGQDEEWCCPDHPNARMYIKVFYDYIDYDYDEHKKISDSWVYCSVCHTGYSMNTDEYDWEKHTFNQHGVCIYCGHQIRPD